MKLFDHALQKWRIRKVLPFIKEGARVLDIGAADGTLYRSLRRCRNYVGVDPSLPSPIDLGPDAVLLKGTFPEALSGGETFDVICMLAVLEHIPTALHPSLAGSCDRYLSAGGVLLLTVPSPRVDRVLAILRAAHLIDGMALEEHYGFDAERTPAVFSGTSLSLKYRRQFQFGLNNLFVFRKDSLADRDTVP